MSSPLATHSINVTFGLIARHHTQSFCSLYPLLMCLLTENELLVLLSDKTEVLLIGLRSTLIKTMTKYFLKGFVIRTWKESTIIL